MTPHNWYTQRIDETSKLLSHTKTQINRISLLRVLLFVAGIAGLILFYSFGTGAIVLTLCCTFLPFFILVKVHNRLYFRKERLEIQLKLNQDELKGLEGDWSAFDEGREFIDPEHPYSYDLDLFGRKSLFQAIGRTCTHIGKQTLAAWMQHHLTEKEAIETRQESIRDMSQRTEFRETFRVTGSVNRGTDSDEEEIDLSEIAYLLWGHILEIVGALLGGAILAFMITFFLIAPKYTATAKMYILTSGTNSVIDLSALQISSQLKADYQELITSRSILEDVIAGLNLQETTVEDLEGMIAIDNPADTRILNVNVTTTDPQMSADIANELVNQAKTYLPEVMKTDEPSIFEQAEVPDTKSSPSIKNNVLIGGAGVAFLYIGYLVVRHLMDDTFKTPDEINKYYGVQPLAVIPEGKIKNLNTKARDKKRGRKK